MRNINDLREYLFDALEGLHDKKNPMEVDRANAIAHVANVIINSVKAENHFLEITASEGTGFIPASSESNERRRLGSLRVFGGSGARSPSGARWPRDSE